MSYSMWQHQLYHIVPVLVSAFDPEVALRLDVACARDL